MDNATIIITGKDFAKTHEKICNIMNQTKGVFKWAKEHNCEFRIEKFQLLDITRKTVPHPLNPKKCIPIPCHALMLGNQHIPSMDMAKFLGVIINNKLNWKGQCTATLAKGQMWLIQVAWITRASRGAMATYIHKLYLSVAAPHMLYAADILLTSQ